MRKRFGYMLLASVLIVFGLSGCAQPPEETSRGMEALECLKAVKEAPEVYVGVSESYYFNDEIVSYIEEAAYVKKNYSAMWHYDSVDGTTENSAIRTVGNSTKNYGDFDFVEIYGKSYASQFISGIITSYTDAITSGNFYMEENKDGFTMSLSNPKLLNKYNSFLYEEIDDQGTLAEKLGGEIDIDLQIDFVVNKFGSIDVTAITRASGEDGNITIKKIVQFILDQDTLKEFKEKADNIDFEKETADVS